MSAYDVLIVGGGLIGSSIAFELSSEKLRVAVLDRQQPGREASWAAAGMLVAGPGFARHFGSGSSRQRKPASLSRIHRRHRTNFRQVHGFHAQRHIRSVPRSESEVATRCNGCRISPPRNSRWRRSRSDEARKHEPSLAPHSGAIAWLPDEATVDPRLLIEAVLAAATAPRRRNSRKLRRGFPAL